MGRKLRAGLRRRGALCAGVFAWLQRDHTSSIDSNMFSYQFTFFYVDLLRNDRANEVEIQSVGIQTLDNIIRALDDLGLEVSGSYVMQPFNQRFADECAGVYCTVTLDAPLGSVCPEEFSDTDGEINDDFLIF